MKSAKYQKRRKRELSERLRPLALLVEMANLEGDEEIKNLRRADQLLLEANGELIHRSSGGFSRTAETVESLRSKMIEAAEETRVILENFEARVEKPRHAVALAALLEHMRLATYARAHLRALMFTLFEVIAAVRNALIEVAINLASPDGQVRLPEECYQPRAVLYRKHNRITAGIVPVGQWLLPILEGLEAGRLKVCGGCKMLYVARRRDQLGCSQRCGDTEYMRRYRRAAYRKGNKRTVNSLGSAGRRLNVVRTRN